jgi:hypothetical protein
MDREALVYVDLDAVPHLMRRLWARTRKNQESATFEYDKTWLENPARFSLEPALRVGPGTLEVSDKLNEVRGAIEEKQAEFEVLSKQVETVVINITLRAEADAQVFGLNWRPLYQLKIAAREGLDGFGEYAASMTAFVFYCRRSCCGCSRSSPAPPWAGGF